jgi:hypothetical protein
MYGYHDTYCTPLSDRRCSVRTNNGQSTESSLTPRPTIKNLDFLSFSSQLSLSSSLSTDYIKLTRIIKNPVLLAAALLRIRNCTSMSSSTASSSSSHQQKAIQEVLRRPPSHWVGDGFKVFPGEKYKLYCIEY